jgi:hypothetical protein
MTETAELADVVLRRRVCRKNGTFTNTEEAAAGQKSGNATRRCKEDSSIILDISRHMGFDMNYILLKSSGNRPALACCCRHNIQQNRNIRTSVAMPDAESPRNSLSLQGRLSPWKSCFYSRAFQQIKRAS